MLLLALLGGCDHPAPVEKGFAGLGNQAAAFKPVVPGRAFSFPADHGPHDGFRIEWWYVTANLKDDQGNEFGAQWTLFRSALNAAPEQAGWGNPIIWLGHAAVTSATVHHAAERYARGGVGQAGVNLTPFSAWIDDWHFSSQASADNPSGRSATQRPGQGVQLPTAADVFTSAGAAGRQRVSVRNPNRARRLTTTANRFSRPVARSKSMARCIRSAARPGSIVSGAASR